MSKVSLALITVAAIVMALASPAAAYWSGQGSATGLASTTTLAAPTNVTAAANGITAVNVSWTAPAGLPASTGYYVTSTKSGVTAAACGSRAQSLVTTTSCTDTALTSGTYNYTVVAVRQSWSTSSAPSNSVVVTGPNKLVVTISPPASVVSGRSITPSVTVRLQSAAGVNLTTSGVPIMIKIDSATATLSGTLTESTNSSGLASFSNLEVNLVGTYTLTATATGYGSVKTASFLVTAGTPASIVIVSGSGQSTRVGTTFAQPFVVRVSDAAGNPVPDQNISFQFVNGQGGTIVGQAQPNTAADGTASVTVKANQNPGSYSLNAYSYYGGTRSVTFTFTNTAAAAAKIAPGPVAPSTPSSESSTTPAATSAPPKSTPPASSSSSTPPIAATASNSSSAPASSAPVPPVPLGSSAPSASAAPSASG